MTAAELMQNTWFVGITGGVLSGLVVYFITKWFFSDQSKREQAQRIAAANREIIYSVRQGVPEGTIPNSAVIHAMINSTARKVSIDVSKLYNIEQLSEELIKEVMDSSFISAKTKEEYCARLVEMSAADHSTVKPRPSRLGADDAARLVTLMSLILGLFTGGVSILLTLGEFRDTVGETISWTDREMIRAVFFPASIAGVSLALAGIISTYLRIRRTYEERKLMLEFDSYVQGSLDVELDVRPHSSLDKKPD